MVYVEALGANMPRSIIAANLVTDYNQNPSACVCVGDEIQERDENSVK